METDKATLDVESTEEDVTLAKVWFFEVVMFLLSSSVKILVDPGTSVKVGTPVALMVEKGEDWKEVEEYVQQEKEKVPDSPPPPADSPKQAASTPVPSSPAKLAQSTQAPPPQQDHDHKQLHEESDEELERQALKFPSVTKLLAEYDISEEDIEPSGVFFLCFRCLSFFFCSKEERGSC